MSLCATPDFDARKFKEAIVYICEKSESDPRFGSVKLNKILFYADFRAYTQLGWSITGATYRHLSEGPAPKEMLSCRAELEDDHALVMENRTYFNRKQKRPVSKRKAQLTLFSGDEVAILAAAIEYLWEKDASEATELSHREWGWKLTAENEDIPYRAAWLSPEPPTQEEVEYARMLAMEQ
jgi:hypothetical protein